MLLYKFTSSMVNLFFGAFSSFSLNTVLPLLLLLLSHLSHTHTRTHSPQNRVGDTHNIVKILKNLCVHFAQLFHCCISMFRKWIPYEIVHGPPTFLWRDADIFFYFFLYKWISRDPSYNFWISEVWSRWAYAKCSFNFPLIIFRVFFSPLFWYNTCVKWVILHRELLRQYNIKFFFYDRERHSFYLRPVA